jgi:hypothetical protein
LKTLLAAKVFLGRLDRDMAEQKLDLVQFPSGVAAQTGASPTEVMRGQIFNGCPSGAFFDDVPYDPLRYAVSPGFACAAHAPKHAAFAHASGYKPGIDGALDPIRNRHRPNMPRLTDQIDYDPVVLPPVKMGNIQFCRFSPAQSATQEDPEQSSISLALECIRVRHLPQFSCLLGGEPVTKTNA